jgi:hypothetical protein
VADLNTVVNGDSTACRGAAGWLGKVASGVDSNRDAIAKAQTDSDACWQGTAADGFRNHIGQMASDADGLAASALTAQQALTKFADELDTVNARMNQARLVAEAAGLAVTPSGIEGPGSAPTHRQGPMGGQEAVEFFQAHLRYTTQVQAFSEAQATVTEARGLEAQAHANVTPPMQEADNTVQALVTISSNVSGVTLNAIQGVEGAAQELYQEADGIESHAQRMEQLALDSELTDAGRAAAARAGQLGSTGAAETEAEAAKIEGAVKKVPQSLRTAIAANPGDMVADSSGLLKVTKGVLRGVPYLGTGVSILFGGVEVLDGSEKPAQAVAETGGSIAGGAIGAASGAEAGGAIGSIFPGLGTVVGGVIGGIAGGIIGTLAGGKAGDAVVGAK